MTKLLTALTIFVISSFAHAYYFSASQVRSLDSRFIRVLDETSETRTIQIGLTACIIDWETKIYLPNEPMKIEITRDNSLGIEQPSDNLIQTTTTQKDGCVYWTDTLTHKKKGRIAKPADFSEDYMFIKYKFNDGASLYLMTNPNDEKWVGGDVRQLPQNTLIEVIKELRKR